MNMQLNASTHLHTSTQYSTSPSKWQQLIRSCLAQITRACLAGFTFCWHKLALWSELNVSNQNNFRIAWLQHVQIKKKKDAITSIQCKNGMKSLKKNWKDKISDVHTSSKLSSLFYVVNDADNSHYLTKHYSSTTQPNHECISQTSRDTNIAIFPQDNSTEISIFINYKITAPNPYSTYNPKQRGEVCCCHHMSLRQSRVSLLKSC
jgi:hypothetical protein